ncbi:MAG: hypothetical protein WKG07_42085 [Hymenobacter sp.]
MQTFVEGVLGLQTRLEFPYLTDVQQFGAEYHGYQRHGHYCLSATGQHHALCARPA